MKNIKNNRSTFSLWLISGVTLVSTLFAFQSDIKSKYCIYLGNLSPTEPITISAIQEQKTLRLVSCDGPFGDTIVGYRILGYRFTSLSKSNSLHEVNIPGKNLVYINQILKKLKAGDFIQFSEIRVKSDNGTISTYPNIAISLQ